MPNLFVLSFFDFLLAGYIFAKIVHYKEAKKKDMALFLCASFFLALISLFLSAHLPFLFRIFLLAFFASLLAAKISGRRVDYCYVVMLIALGIHFLCFFIATSLLFFPLYLGVGIAHDSLVSVLFVVAFTAGLEVLFFHVRRWRGGFAFLENRWSAGVGICIAGVILCAHALLGTQDWQEQYVYFVFGIFLCALGLYLWVTKSIWHAYKEGVKERRIAQLEEENRILMMEVAQLKNLDDATKRANHKINGRLSALERALFEIQTQSETAELAARVHALQTEYDEALNVPETTIGQIVQTQIKSLDWVLGYLLSECEKHEITFDLALHGSIHYMIECVLPLSQLETILCDHVKNAIIAITEGGAKRRKIFVELGVLGDCYGLCIHDTGVAFSAETLLQLGNIQATTYPQKGGSGIGFITTFALLRHFEASLVILERNPEEAHFFTKSLSFRFDGKATYVLRTWRGEALRRAGIRRTGHEIIDN